MARAEASGERDHDDRWKSNNARENERSAGARCGVPPTHSSPDEKGHCARRAIPSAFVATHLSFRANGVESRDAPRGERGGAPRGARPRSRRPTRGPSPMSSASARAFLGRPCSRAVGRTRPFAGTRALGEGDPSRRWRALDSRRAVAVSAERPPRRRPARDVDPIRAAPSPRAAQHVLPPRPRASAGPVPPRLRRARLQPPSRPNPIPGGRAPRVGRRPSPGSTFINVSTAVTKLDNRLSGDGRARGARARTTRPAPRPSGPSISMRA